MRRLLLFLVVVLGIAAAGGCENRPVHAFNAEQYDPVRDCLLAETAVDVVEGADPGPCEATRCWESPAGDVYVTTAACDAPPDFTDRSSDPEGSPCAKALDALERKARCDP